MYLWRGCDRRLSRGRLEQGRRRRAVARCARPASRGDQGERVEASDRRRRTRLPADRDQRSGRARPAGLRDRLPEGASGLGSGRADAAAARQEHRRRHRPERRAVVVRLWTRKAFRDCAAAQRRSAATGNGMRSARERAIGCVVYPATEIVESGRCETHLRRQVFARRTRRQHVRALSAPGRSA